MNKYIVILFFICCGNFLLSQKNDREDFIKTFSKETSALNDKKIKDFIQKELKTKLLSTNDFSEEQFKIMKSTSLSIIEKRNSYYPEVYQYVTAFYGIVEQKRPQKEFETWHDYVLLLLQNRNPQRIKDFLETSSLFFYENTLYQKDNYHWICRDTDYEFYVTKKGAEIKFDKVTLICKVTNKDAHKNDQLFTDSLKIENTKGVADLISGRWRGKTGVLTWEKAGLPANETNATLNNYNLSFRTPALTADSVLLKTPYFNQPVLGKLTDRAFKNAARDDNKNPFPQFNSYKADYEIKNLIDSVDYEGGFSLNGDEFIGIGNKNKSAKLTYYHNNKTFITFFTNKVNLNNSELKMTMAQFSIHVSRRDSIYHPGLNVTIDVKSKDVRFTRGNSPITQAPFVDSYHQLNIYIEELILKKETNQLVLGFDKFASEHQRVANFESLDYYDEQLFQKIQGLASVHPLVALYNYAWKYDKFEMDEGTAATALGRTTDQAKPQLFELSSLGFINYDSERGRVTINDKTGNFVKAKSGKIDYDNISFSSNLAPIRLVDNNQNNESALARAEKIKKRNEERSRITEYGIIDLKTLNMQINAVDNIPIANSSNTVIYPENNIATIQRNRNIFFYGWVNSGKWEVKIDRGSYNYNENKFNISSSEVALFMVNPLRKEDGNSPVPLQSYITGIQGELIVNTTDNRSGLKKGFEQYPILISKEKTKVFYNQEQLYKGAYNKDRFYFELIPFEVDSLASFNEKAQRFKGTLYSAGIFPNINDELKVMPDYSLGFSQKVPEDGYRFYSTNGKYNHQIVLSNNGLQGGGTIDFINSTSTSKSLFTFLPDSTIGVASFINRPQESGVQFPDAEGSDVFMTFLPHKEILKVRSNKEPISFFEDETKFTGTATIKKTGMNGKGTLNLPNASLYSINMRFSRWNTLADTSYFFIKNNYKDDVMEDPMALKAENVKSNLDFKNRKGIFNSNKGESVVDFPANQYICKISQFTWFMDKDEMLLEREEEEKNSMDIEVDIDFAGSNFFSTHPRQDSLQFRSPKAKFDLKGRIIYAYNVDYIEVADARIYPDSSKVIIHKNARMEQFKNAEIIANIISKYHRIIDASVEITARKAYTGNGHYEFINSENEKQYIQLTEIKLDPSFQTIAKGNIKQNQNFKLSSRFSYYGGVSIQAANKFLFFNGATQISHNCDKFEKNWLSFEANIDPDNIQIPIGKEMKDMENNKISVGIRWRASNNPELVVLYPTFLSALAEVSDPSVFSASGFLQYDTLSQEYQIASKEKLINRNESGNYISLHTQTCSLNGDGEINLGIDLGPLESSAIGVINYNQETEATEMNITLAIRLPLDHKPFENIAVKINKTEGLKGPILNLTTLEQSLVEWTDLSTADKIKANYTLNKEFKTVPKQLQDAIVITGLKLKSYTKEGEQRRGLISNDNQVTIVNIFKEPVMKNIPFKFFAETRINLGGRLGLLLDVPGSDNYFIDYDYRKDGVMNIITEDTDFNDALLKLKSKEKKTRNFIYDISNKTIYKEQFLRVFN